MSYFRVLFFINLTGIFWFISSLFLFFKGGHYLWDTTNLSYGACLAGICFFIGTMKSKYVLSKSVKTIVSRARSSIPFYRIYGARFYILIGSMIAMGMCMNLLSIHPLIRGCIDLSIAFALMQGAFQYFKIAFKGSYL